MQKLWRGVRCPKPSENRVVPGGLDRLRCRTSNTCWCSMSCKTWSQMPPLPEMKGAPRPNRIFDSENDLLGIAIVQLRTTCVARTKAIKAIVASSGKTQKSLKTPLWRWQVGLCGLLENHPTPQRDQSSISPEGRDRPSCSTLWAAPERSKALSGPSP